MNPITDTDRAAWQRACDKATIMIEVLFWGALLGQVPWDVYFDELTITEIPEEPLRGDPWGMRRTWDTDGTDPC